MDGAEAASRVRDGEGEGRASLSRRILVKGVLLGCAALAGAAAPPLREARGAAAEADGDVRAELFAELPAWATWRERDFACDLDGDGSDETLALHGMRFTATDGGDVLLETPDGWLVFDAYAADLDADGLPEVVLLVWRRGSYGDARPFWVEGGAGDEEPSQHVFVYRWDGGVLRPVWMSSALGVEVAAADLSDDGRLRLTAPDGSWTLWEWDSWGFSLVGEGAGSPEAQVSDADAALARATLLVVGDNIAHANVYEGAYDPQTQTYDFSPLYEPVLDLVASCDLAAVCQETPLVANPARRSSYPRFATPTAMGNALAGAGFDVVLAATNHVNDAGATGLGDTLAFWAENHPETVLLGLHPTPEDQARTDVVEVNGIRLALFDYTYGLNGLPLDDADPYRVDTLDDEDRLLDGVAAARMETDAVVCFLHIGEEYRAAPTDGQRDLVRRLVAVGADAVVCSHTHVLGPYGTVRVPASDGTGATRTGTVYYGLGNFMSGQLGDVATVVGGAARIVFEKRAGADGGERTAVAEYGLVPLVCHTEASDGSVAVYPLDGYTDELAARHALSSDDGPLTVERLRLQVKEGLAGATDVRFLAR